MKFYFCEACGKRITEKEIEEGLGRDKKLKGVFCAQCSVGVMTMESLPISEDQARKILHQGPTPPRVLEPAARRPSSGRLATMHRAPHSTATQLPSPRRSAHTAIFVIAGSVAAVLLLWALASRQDSPAKSLPSAAPAAPPSATLDRTVIPKVPSKPDLPVMPLPPPAPTPSPTETSRQIYERLVRFEDLAPQDREGRIVRLEAFLASHGADETTDQAQSLLAQLKREREAALAAKSLIAPSPPPPSPQAPIAPALPAPPLPDPLLEARAAYAEFSERYFVLLAKWDEHAASARLAQAADDPVLKPLAHELLLDRKALGWLSDLLAAAPKGAERLKEVDRFDLLLVRGETMPVGTRAPFQVLELKTGILQVGQKGLVLPVPLTDLTTETVGKLSDLGLDNDGAGKLRRAFGRVLEISKGKDGGGPSTQSVRGFIDQAREAGAAAEDCDYLKSRLEAAGGYAREGLAVELLAQFDKLREAKEWTPAEQIGAKVLQSFSDTRVVKARAGLKDEWKMAARKGAPVREYTLIFQTGQPIPAAGITAYSGARSAFINGMAGHENLRRGTLPEYWAGYLNADVLIRFLVFESQGGVLPNDSDILEARLQLFRTTPASIIESRRVLSAWKPEEVTYASASQGHPWGTPGGDVGPRVVSVNETKTSWPGWFDLDVTQDLREAQVDGKNFGWRLVALNQNGKPTVSSVRICSEIHPKETQRPKLLLKVRCAPMMPEEPAKPAQNP